MPTGSAYSAWVEVCASTRWSIAVSRPWASAASATSCTVAERRPTRVNICARVSSRRTGRPVRLAASMVSSSQGNHSWPLQPNPPPSRRDTTRAPSGGRPKAWVTTERVPNTAWVQVWTTAWSPSHQHTATCGSMGWWLLAAVS